MLKPEDKEAIDRLIEDLPRYAELLSNNFERDPMKVLDAFQLLRLCCHRFYDVRIAEYEATSIHLFRGSTTQKPQLLADTLLPWAHVNVESAAVTLKKLLLFSDFSVLTLPHSLQTMFISHFKNRSQSWPALINEPTQRAQTLYENRKALAECFALNLKYERLVTRYQLLFLPQTIQEYTIDQERYQELVATWDAPFKQLADAISYVPYNEANLRLNAGEQPFYVGRPEWRVFHSFDLPYFPELDFDDLIKIKLHETDAFPRFQHFLRTKLEGLSNVSNITEIRQIAEEIEYEVYRLNLEVKKLANLKILQGAGIGIFSEHTVTNAL